jgi:hypothetical protein
VCLKNGVDIGAAGSLLVEWPWVRLPEALLARHDIQHAMKLKKFLDIL